MTSKNVAVNVLNKQPALTHRELNVVVLQYHSWQDSVVDLFPTYKLTLDSITVDSSKKPNLKKQKPRWSMINSLLYMTDFNYHTHNFSKCKMRLKRNRGHGNKYRWCNALPDKCSWWPASFQLCWQHQQLSPASNNKITLVMRSSCVHSWRAQNIMYHVKR